MDPIEKKWKEAVAYGRSRYHEIDDTTLKEILAMHERFREFSYLGKGKKILDVGCGNGILHDKSYEESGWYGYIGKDQEIYGCDILAYHGFPGMGFARCDARDLPWKGGSFDGVVDVASMQHIPEPWKVYGEIHRVLKDGGVFFQWIGIGEHQPDGGLMPNLSHPFHLYRYSANAVRRLFAGHGFEGVTGEHAARAVYFFKGRKKSATAESGQ